ncbi:MAG: TlpA family protein disulfide reductase [Rubrivivax sp.]|nr:TlpA family protein disulfide reductase [Rubrivivax sp.]
MLSISVGPLALPVAPLVLLAAIALAAGLARRLAPREPAEARQHADGAVMWAALVGLVVARASHLALNAGAYAAHPWAVLDIRDGGFVPVAGFVAGGAWLAWRALRWPTLRRALAGGALAGLVVWGAGQGALHWAAGTRPLVPDVPLVHLETARAQPLPALLAGRPAVVNVWATWCAPCREEMPALAAAERRHPQVRFVFVNHQERAELVQRYLAAERLALQQVWLDPEGALLVAAGSRGLPTTLFFDAQGRRVGAHFGVLNAAALDSRLRGLARP